MTEFYSAFSEFSLQNPAHCVPVVLVKNLQVIGACNAISESPCHADCENISCQFKHRGRRVKIRILSGPHPPDFLGIQIFGFKTGLYRKTIEFCVENW